MKFRDNYSDGFFTGKRNKFLFTITKSKINGLFYVFVEHETKDIRFDSRWSDKYFKDFDLAKTFCSNFDYKDYACLGEDV